MKIKSALAKKVELKQDTPICISDDLQYCLAGNSLCRISALHDGEFSASEIAVLKFGDSLPPVQWILSYSVDKLFLVGSQTLGIEKAIRFCGEPDPSLGHEIYLVPEEVDHEALGSLAQCSHCLQMRRSDAYWKCHSCRPSAQMTDDEFRLCMKCIYHGTWCHDKIHDLVRNKDEEQKIGWRATHAVYEVDLQENECRFGTIYEARTFAPNISQPVLNKSLGLLTWRLDDSRMLTLTLATGESKISVDVEGVPIAHPQVSLVDDQQFANRDDIRTAIAPEPNKNCLANGLSAPKSLSFSGEEVARRSNPRSAPSVPSAVAARRW